MATNASIISRNNIEIGEKTGNIFSSIAVIGKRARQIASLQKEDLNGKLAEFASSVDNLEEIFENREQIEISKFYERMPKPASTAIDEFLAGDIMFRLADAE